MAVNSPFGDSPLGDFLPRRDIAARRRSASAESDGTQDGVRLLPAWKPAQPERPAERMRAASAAIASAICMVVDEPPMS